MAAGIQPSCCPFLAVRKKNLGKSLYHIVTLVVAFLLHAATLPAMAIADEDHVAGDNQRQPETSPGLTENRISKLKLPKSAYEVNDSISNLLGIQFPSWAPKLLGMQATGIYQNMPSFHSPYQGNNSLRFDHGLGQKFTHSYGIYFGSQITKNLQAYLDIEMFRGNGVSHGLGLGGYVNGDLIRAGPANLGQNPYLARLFLRYFIPLSEERNESPEPGIDELPSRDPTSRIEIKFGRFAITDDIDLNRYSNNQRTQFFNYAFLYNPAWDYASDTRGYSQGISVSFVKPTWRLTFGWFQINTIANGMDLDWRIGKTGGYNLELTLKPNKFGTVIRFLGYYNQGNMGRYRDALNIAAEHATTPDVIVLDEKIHRKYGFGINLEQPLADNGETGLFARAGWSDGHTSFWSYAEADRHLSVGAQVSGVHWKRAEDRFGIAFGVQSISSLHKQYLAEGGMGVLVGDGKLNYRPEQVLELYYRIQLGRYIQISPDFQNIWNPGYNRDRGPAQVYGLRLHLSY